MHRPQARVAALLTVLLGLLILPAAASAADGVVERQVPKADAKSAADYWTPKRMRSADPLPLPSQPGTAGSGALAAPQTASAPAAPLNRANTLPPRAPRGLPKVKPGDRPPFASGAVPPATQETYPTSTNGRLFGTLRGLGEYSCSATVVSSGSRSVIMTAGHCVYDFNAGFASRVIFVPAYNDGKRPFGIWRAATLVSTRQWARATNFNYDYAAIRLRKSRGRMVGDVVGEQGVAFNQSRKQDFQAIGYPFNFAKAELMWNCDAPFAGVDPRDRFSGPPDSAIGCDMKAGASGGGWFITDETGTQFLNSVTSFGYRGIRKTLFGPYLTRRVTQVLDMADRR